DGDADLPDFTGGHRTVGVVAALGGQVEGHGEAGLTLVQQVAIARVGLFGAAEAAVLAHGPEAAAVHGGLDAAGEWVFAREAEVGGRVEAGEVVLGVNGLDGHFAGRLERLLPLPGPFEGLCVGALQPIALRTARHVCATPDNRH